MLSLAIVAVMIPRVRAHALPVLLDVRILVGAAHDTGLPNGAAQPRRPRGARVYFAGDSLVAAAVGFSRLLDRAWLTNG